MKNKIKSNIVKLIKEDSQKMQSLVDDIVWRNNRYSELINNPPDMSKEEPMALYYWAKEIAELFL